MNITLDPNHLLKLLDHGLTMQSGANPTTTNILPGATTGVSVTTDNNIISVHKDSCTAESINNDISQAIELAIKAIDSDDSTVAVYLEISKSVVPNDITIAAYIGHHILYNFGFRLPIGTMNYIEETGLLKASLLISAIPPLKLMQENYDGSLFDEIEDYMVEMVANGYGDINNGSDRSITASEVDAIINSDVDYIKKGSIFINALLAVIFSEVKGVNFMSTLSTLPSALSTLSRN